MHCARTSFESWHRFSCPLDGLAERRECKARESRMRFFGHTARVFHEDHHNVVAAAILKPRSDWKGHHEDLTHGTKLLNLI